MKKYIGLFILIIILVMGSSVKAESFFAEISGDKILMKSTASDGSIEIKSVEIYNLENYKYFGIRNMAECVGADISWNDSTKTVLLTYKNLVISLKNNNNEIFINGNKYDFGYPIIIIDGKSYAPLELYKAFTGELKPDDDKSPRGNNDKSTGNTGISIENGENADRVLIYGAATGIVHNFRLSNPSRIIFDIKNIDIHGTYSDGVTFYRIRHFKGADGITRLVFDLKAAYKYTLNYEGSNLVLVISDTGSFSKHQDLIEFRNNSVIIKAEDYSGYKIRRSTEPFTITAEFPRILIKTAFTLLVDGEYVKRISTKIENDNTIVKVELTAQCSFKIEKLKGAFILGIYKPVVNGVVYHKNDEDQFILLDYLKKSNAVKEIINKNNEIIVKLEDSEKKITSGQVYINDESIKSIFVSRSGNMVTLRITTKENRFAEAVLSNGIVKLNLNEKDYSGFLVAISAGHGGSDPGAIVNKVYEAHLNLAISKKLKENLENAGVKVYMIRKDDTFVSLDYRTEKANTINADLFISIHCNSLENTDFDGLMTLVHSGKLDYNHINGKTAGSIIHKEVIKSTGATDRGLRNRDKIIVLKDTKMPAVEIECGFMTNPAELKKLLTDSYQQIIVDGATTGILKVLDLMNQ